MKQLLFRGITYVIGSMISVNTSVGNMLTTFIAFAFNAINEVLRLLAKSLMNLVDTKRFEYLEATQSQYSELSELNLLMQAASVKENALSHKTWTVMHSIAINKIGAALHHNCGWEPARIHAYMRQVVESIPGLVYNGGDEYEQE
jgi:hypothetical protein